jgi:hypothetical protein
MPGLRPNLPSPAGFRPANLPPPAAKTGVTTSLDPPTQNGRVRGVPDPLGKDFEQVLRLYLHETCESNLGYGLLTPLKRNM